MKYDPLYKKRTFGHVLPAKIQISLCIRTVWSESSLGAFLDSQGYSVSSWGQLCLWSNCADAVLIWDLIGHTYAKVRFLTFRHILLHCHYVERNASKGLLYHVRIAKVQISHWVPSMFADIFCSFYITKTRLFKYIENFTTKPWKFSDRKNSYMFHISAQNILTSTHNLCFWAEIRKIMYTPVNPSFTI